MSEQNPEKLRIAVLSSPIITAPATANRVPPGWSGAPENVMYTIARGLAQKGNSVTLFASGETKAPEVTTYALRKKSSYEDPEIGISGNKAIENGLIAACYDMAKQGMFDVVISRYTAAPKDLVEDASVPTIVVEHSPLSDRSLEELHNLPKDQYNVFISHTQRKGYEFMQTVPGMPVIYHGVDLEKFPFNPSGGNNFLFLGRLVEAKNPDVAIKAALRANVALELVGSNWGNETKPWDKDSYWDKTKELLKSKSAITQVGFVDHEVTSRYYQHAKAVLMPSSAKEPFGLVAIEAMASGTPIIAFNQGALSEIIIDGVTGFLVKPSDGVRGFVKAIKKLNALSPEKYQEMRQACRSHIEKNFTQERMIEDYEEAVRRVTRLR